jgi:hypothetical protein
VGCAAQDDLARDGRIALDEIDHYRWRAYRAGFRLPAMTISPRAATACIRCRNQFRLNADGA